jgi:hypothetical protein
MYCIYAHIDYIYVCIYVSKYVYMCVSMYAPMYVSMYLRNVSICLSVHPVVYLSNHGSRIYYHHYISSIYDSTCV